MFYVSVSTKEEELHSHKIDELNRNASSSSSNSPRPNQSTNIEFKVLPHVVSACAEPFIIVIVVVVVIVLLLLLLFYYFYVKR